MEKDGKLYAVAKKNGELVPYAVMQAGLNTEAGGAAKRKIRSNFRRDLVEAVEKFRRGDFTFMDLLLERALRENDILLKLLDKMLPDQTPDMRPQVFQNFETRLLQIKAERGDMLREEQVLPALSKLPGSNGNGNGHGAASEGGAA